MYLNRYLRPQGWDCSTLLQAAVFPSGRSLHPEMMRAGLHGGRQTHASKSSQSTILPERNVYIDEKKRGGKLFLVGIKRVVFVLCVIGRQAGRGGGYLLLHVRHTRLTYRRCKSIIVLTEIILKSTKKLKVPIFVSRYLYF